MQITTEEFRKLAGAVKVTYPNSRIKVGAPPKETENTDKLRCKDCRKLLWDCRCK